MIIGNKLILKSTLTFLNIIVTSQYSVDTNILGTFRQKIDERCCCRCGAEYSEFISLSLHNEPQS